MKIVFAVLAAVYGILCVGCYLVWATHRGEKGEKQLAFQAVANGLKCVAMIYISNQVPA